MRGRHLAYQSEPQRLLRIDTISGQEQQHGAGSAYRPWQTLSAAAARYAAQPHLRQPEAGVLGGDANVAGQRQLQPAANRMAVDGADDGLGDVHARQDVVGLAATECQLGKALLGRHRLLQVGSGAERLIARTRQNDGPDAVVGGNPGPGPAQFSPGFRIDRVHGFWPRQGKRRDAILDGEL
ncbi:hypothetical protein D3C87_1314950 [compost metagenome]